MSRYAQFKVFSMLYGIVYMVFFYFNWAPFRYYPVLEEFRLEPLPLSTAGPAILWYAWLAAALVISLIVSALFPRKWADRIWHGWVWIVPTAVIVGILFYEKRWFF